MGINGWSSCPPSWSDSALEALLGGSSLLLHPWVRDSKRLRNLDADIVYLAVWPANLVFCTLFNTLHSQQYQGIGSRGGMTRQRFFNYVFCGGVLWCTSRILSIKFNHSLRTQTSFLDTCLPHSPCFRGCVGSNQTTLWSISCLDMSMVWVCVLKLNRSR